MSRFVLMLSMAIMLAMPTAASAQRQDPVAAVQAVATRWNDAFNRRDAAAILELFDERPIGGFIFGGSLMPRDSLRAFHERVWATRTNESWTIDRADVVMLDDDSALLTITWTGRYTTPSNVTWEFKSSAFATAIVQRRGSAWRVVAMHNSASGTQVRR